jgi:hypothetical protein
LALPAWTLAALALVPVLLAARLAVALDRASAFIAMQIGLAAWLVTASIEQLTPGDPHWLSRCFALAVPALMWVGARQWRGLPHPWVAPSPRMRLRTRAAIQSHLRSRHC